MRRPAPPPQSDMTKAANHIDFTSKTFAGPQLMEGKRLLAEARAKQAACVRPRRARASP